MIPKIIHYCWFGGKEKPQDVKETIKNWKRILPDYEIKEWNESNFDVNCCTFSKEANAMKSWAFVADVCRLKALYEYGGIYLDTDVEVIKPFDDYLSQKSFLSREHKWIGLGMMAAEKGAAWVGKFLDFYNKRHFINIFGHPVRTANTKLFTLYVYPGLSDDEKPELYPMEYFCAVDWNTGEKHVTENTVCIHNYAYSWGRRKKTLLTRIKIIVKGLAVRYIEL